MSEYTDSLRVLLQNYMSNETTGLTSEQAGALLEQYGENRLESKNRRTLAQSFLGRLASPVSLILIAVAAISGVIAVIEKSGFIDPVIILLLTALGAVLGAWREDKAERSLDSLKEVTAPTAGVLRDGSIKRIPAAEIVPGDIVLLEVGDIIPADGRIIESSALKCEESALTGENTPVNKDAKAKVLSYAAPGDRANMVYAGCSVIAGSAKVLATATGMETEMGRISELLNITRPEPAPLLEAPGRMGKYLVIVAAVACAILLVIGLIAGASPAEILKAATSLITAALPIGLATAIAVTLAVGAGRMASKNAIISRVELSEALAGVSVICLDKAGVITQGCMTVMGVWPAGRELEAMTGETSPKAAQVIRLAAMCCDGPRPEGEAGDSIAVGDPGEAAIISAAAKLGIDKGNLDEEYPRLTGFPLDPESGLTTTIHQVGEGYLAVIRGGLDRLIPLCVSGKKSRAEEISTAMSDKLLQVVAVACRTLEALPDDITREEIENGLNFIGLIGMLDPVREETPEAVALCRRAGIRAVMFTEEDLAAAKAIARETGILAGSEDAISGGDLRDMSDEALELNIKRYSVYADITPEDKERIAKVWRRSGATVALTGGSVADLPALAAADIGCVMGMEGSDMARGAADMLVTGDSFDTIVKAIGSGRCIRDNIVKAARFILSSNIGGIIAVFIAAALGWGVPLTAVQLLLVGELVCVLAALALGAEPMEKNIMDREPVPKERESALKMWIPVALQGIMMAIIILTAYRLGATTTISPLIPPSHITGVTMAFLTFALSQLTQAFNFRSQGSLFRTGWLGNRELLKASLISVCVVAVIYAIPLLAGIFKIAPISVAHWFWVLGLSLAPIIIVEIAKQVRGFIRPSAK